MPGNIWTDWLAEQQGYKDQGALPAPMVDTNMVKGAKALIEAPFSKGRSIYDPYWRHGNKLLVQPRAPRIGAAAILDLMPRQWWEAVQRLMTEGRLEPYEWTT